MRAYVNFRTTGMIRRDGTFDLDDMKGPDIYMSNWRVLRDSRLAERTPRAVGEKVKV